MDAQAQRAEFWTDLASAARALRSQPSVPLVSLAVYWLPCILPLLLLKMPHSAVVAWIGMVAQWAGLLFLLGWYGGERVFFQRQLEGKPVTVRHLLGLVRPFMGRFFVLGLPFGIVLLGFFAIAFSFYGWHRGAFPTWALLTLSAFLVVMDFALTFVTSALAYTTRSALRALGIGFGMIRQTWPRCALYVLCPPLALNVWHMLRPASSLGVQWALPVLLVVVSLLAKGAIAAFYLRERGSYSDDGAAYITEGHEPPGSVPLTTLIDHRRSR